MDTATTAPSAADRSPQATRPITAGTRGELRELAAHLNLHSGFSDVVASLEAGHGGALPEQSFEEFIARDAKMVRHVAQDRRERAYAERVVPRHGCVMLSILIGR